jgi:hypothetical protein
METNVPDLEGFEWTIQEHLQNDDNAPFDAFCGLKSLRRLHFDFESLDLDHVDLLSMLINPRSVFPESLKIVNIHKIPYPDVQFVAIGDACQQVKG